MSMMLMMMSTTDQHTSGIFHAKAPFPNTSTDSFVRRKYRRDGWSWWLIDVKAVGFGFDVLGLRLEVERREDVDDADDAVDYRPAYEWHF